MLGLKLSHRRGRATSKLSLLHCRDGALGAVVKVNLRACDACRILSPNFWGRFGARKNGRTIAKLLADDPSLQRNSKNWGPTRGKPTTKVSEANDRLGKQAGCSRRTEEGKRRLPWRRGCAITHAASVVKAGLQLFVVVVHWVGKSRRKAKPSVTRRQIAAAQAWGGSCCEGARRSTVSVRKGRCPKLSDSNRLNCGWIS
jgi:hypothetical protein